MSTLSARKVFLVDSALSDRIRQTAEQRDISEGQLIRDGVVKHLNQLDGAAKRATNQNG